MFDVLADTMFRINLDPCLHRRSETQVKCVSVLLEKVRDCRGEESTRAKILTAARGYGKGTFMELIGAIGFRIIFMMPEHLVSACAIVGQSV